MNTPEDLLLRLDQIGDSLAVEPTALALLGLGSVGVELERLDEYSDLDFFVVVKDGAKGRFLDSLDWMSRIHPIGYAFRNTNDGYKLLFGDGIFCEFAVFETADLEKVAYPPARIVWMAKGFDESFASPRSSEAVERRPVDHLVGEALTNLYVGLLRERRGERMAAFRMIQGHALDRIMELTAYLEEPTPAPVDPFAPERRFEARHPNVAATLPGLAQGYARNKESAAAMLGFIEQRFSVPEAIRSEIVALLNA